MGTVVPASFRTAIPPRLVTAEHKAVRRGFLAAAWAACQHVRRQDGPKAAAVAVAAMARHAIGRRVSVWFQRPLVRRDGVLFVGYLDAALGLGESLRGLVRSVAAQGLPFALRPITAGVEDRPLGPFLPEWRDMTARYDINVIEVAADQLPHVYGEMQSSRFTSSYNILRTYWELSRVPAEWVPMLHGIDEIWAPNRFVAEAFADGFRGPVTIIPPCVDVGVARGVRHDRANRPFRFMFSFDYQSSPIRKNPLAVVRAFKAAFPQTEQGVVLLVKSTGMPPPHLASPACQVLQRALQEVAASDPRIEVVDRILPRDGMLDLIAQSDCYVSLHRSEGFGLGMAEAMALGTAVIGTDYSGCEFLTQETGFPVACSLVPVDAGEYPGHVHQVWAQPDETDAAAAMRRVFQDRAAVASRISAASALMADRYGLDSVGRLAVERLGQIQDVIRKARMP